MFQFFCSYLSLNLILFAYRSFYLSLDIGESSWICWSADVSGFCSLQTLVHVCFMYLFPHIFLSISISSYLSNPCFYFILFHFLLNKNTSITSHCVSLTNFKAPVRRLEATCKSTTNAIQKRSDDISGHFQPALATYVISNNQYYRTANVNQPNLPNVSNHRRLLQHFSHKHWPFSDSSDQSTGCWTFPVQSSSSLIQPLAPFDWHKGILITDLNKMISTFRGRLLSSWSNNTIFFFFWTGYSRAVPASMLCDRGRLFYCKPFTSLIASL